MLKVIPCVFLHSQVNLHHHLLQHVHRNLCKVLRGPTFRNIHRHYHHVSTEKPRRISCCLLNYSRAKATDILKNNVWCKYGRFCSSSKDDDTLNAGLDEVKDGLEKSGKISGNDSNSDTENVTEQLEKLGFTSEEIISVLKNAKETGVTDNTDSDSGSSDSDSNSSDSDSDSSDSESDNEKSEEIETLLGTDSDVANTERRGEGEKEKEKGMENKAEDWAVVKMKQDSESDWSVVEVEDFVNFVDSEPDIQETWKPPVELVRGKAGVYDIDELVTVLRAANALDIFTIRIPAEQDFCDHMVIASAKSQRHIQAITSDVKWIYKKKKYKSDKYCKVEGEKTDWQAMDLGNIVLHIFLPATRELYDLETLWTVGVKFDPQCAEESKDPYVFSADDLPWLKELEQSTDNIEKQDTSYNNIERKRQRKTE